MLLDKSGHIIAHPDPTRLGRSIRSESWFQAIAAGEMSGTVYQNYQGQDLFISYVTLPSTGWKLVGFIPQTTIKAAVLPIRNRTIAVCAISSCLAILLSIFISATLGQRINHVITAMDRVEAGDLQARCDLQTGDEFGEIAYKFNVMVYTIRKLNKERDQKEKELEVQKTYFQQLFENSPENVVILDKYGRIINANTRFQEFFQYFRAELIGSQLNSLVVPPHLVHEGAELNKTILANKVVEKETVRQRKDGSLVDVFVLGYPIFIDGRLAGVYGIYRDITERKEAERKLQYYSLHDPLTGAYNRAYFEQQMDLLDAGEAPLGLILCDVDGLKLINDTLGHHVGDELLIVTARVIKASLPEAAFLARIGGDEFAVIMPGILEKDLEDTCHLILENIRLYNEGKSITLSISLGYALRLSPLTSMKDVFREADNYMYKKKLNRSQSTRSAIVTTLMKTLESRDFITEGHALRLQKLVSMMAEKLGLSAHQSTDLQLFAQFHDSRILAIADAYDAMTNDRPYRNALTHDTAMQELQRDAGVKFDPDLVETFAGLF